LLLPSESPKPWTTSSSATPFAVPPDSCCMSWSSKLS
jgi:hypothetical protein